MSPGATNPRVAAFHLLQNVASGGFADRTAERHLSGLEARDRALAMQIAYGCIRLRARLDHELAGLVDRELDRLDRPVLAWLRIGLFQLREMRVPPHAAVHESVEGVRATVGAHVTGYVNGVLRAAIRRGRGGVFPDPEEDAAGYLVTYGSHPGWLVRRWLERWPVEAVRGLVERNNTPPRVTIRLPGGIGQDGAFADVGDDIELRPLSDWPHCYELASGDPGRVLERAGGVVQDPAAAAVVEYVGRDVEGPFLDVCAAPGGKALALVPELPEQVLYVAADRSHERLRRLASVARRRRLPVRTAVMDGRMPAAGLARTILLDVPCTGTGVLRRRPDARWRIDEERLRSVVELQRELLGASAKLLAPGGLLVYATCSLEPEENEEQVNGFLEDHDMFRREAPPEGLSLPRDVVEGDGTLRVLPWQHDTDGSFAVRLRKEAV